MKKTIILLFVTLYITAAIAQAPAPKLKATESKEKIGNGTNNALVITVFEADKATIEKEWKSLMKGYNGKVTVSESSVFADNTVIKTMGNNNTIDVYARIEKVKEGESRLIVGFDLGGAYLSSSQHPQQFKEAQRIVNEFAAKTTKEAIDAQLKIAQKQLQKLTDQQEDLAKDSEDLKKDIESYKAKIKSAEETIAKNNGEMEKKKKEVEVQKKVVDGIAAKQKAVE